MQRTRLSILLAVALVLPTAAAWVYFVVLATHPWAGAVYLLSKVVQFSLPVVAVRFLGAPGPLVALPRPRRTDLLQGLFWGCLLAAAVGVAYFVLVAGTPLAATGKARIEATLAVFQVRSLPAYLAMSLFLSLLHALAEELYWRGYVFRQLAERIPLGLAYAVAGLGFAAHHGIVLGRYLPESSWYTLGAAGVVAVALGGVLWCWLWRRSGNLWAAWLSHIGVDAALMTIGYLLVFR
jgi:uncharacterized protein